MGYQVYNPELPAYQKEGNKEPECLGQWCPDYVTTRRENSLFALIGP